MRNEKRGVSELIGYLMLVTFTVIIASIVFVWLRSYVPNDSLQCPEGTSVFIRESSFDEVTNELKLVLKNTGRFDVAGFFIHASNTSAETGTLDLSEYSTDGGTKFGNSIVYVLGANTMSPGDTKTVTFDIPEAMDEPLSVDIIPVRYQVEDNRERFVSCSTAKVGSAVGEPGEENVCLPEDAEITCDTWICGSRANNCGELIVCLPDNCEASGDVCNNGACTDPVPACGNSVLNSGETCDDGNTAAGDGCSGTCQIESGWGCVNSPMPSVCSLLCGNGALTSGETCDDGGAVNGDGCSGACAIESGWECDNTPMPSTCNLICGNGVINTGEQCDDGDASSGDGCSATCQVESGYNCVGQPSICTPTSGGAPSCNNYCISQGYSSSTCPANNGQCTSQGGIPKPGGNSECIANGAPTGSKCCCFT